MTPRELSIAGRRFAYDDTEAGDRAVVLLHAFPLDRRMWASSLARLAPVARVIAPDLRGFGRSELGAFPPSIAELTNDVITLLDAVGVRRAVVAGLSMGGYVALALAAHHPERLAAIVLADTRAAADSDEVRRARTEALALVRTSGVGAYVDRQLPRLLSASATVDVRDRVRSIGVDQAAPSVEAGLLALRDRPDRSDGLPRITCPALVIVGREDGITPPPEAAAMAGALPDARLVELPDAGHLSNLEAPEAFDDAVASFVRQLSPSRTAPV